MLVAVSVLSSSQDPPYPMVQLPLPVPTIPGSLPTFRWFHLIPTLRLGIQGWITYNDIKVLRSRHLSISQNSEA